MTATEHPENDSTDISHTPASASPSSRDLLMLEQANLSLESTLLAYVRTAILIVASGFCLVKFFLSGGMHLLGYILITAGVGTLIIGLMRFSEVRLRFLEIQRKTTADSNK